MTIRIPIVSEYNNKGVKDAQAGVSSLELDIKDLGKSVLAGFAVDQVFEFGKAAVNAASDLAESANAVSVTFGDATDSINKLAEDAVNAYGMSTTEFNTFAVKFSGFAKQIAGDGGDVSEVIDNMGTRIADFASVHNLSLQDAGAKFQSAMAGSSEVVREYGIDLSAAAVEQYALERGLAASKAEMDETIKVQARYELLLESTNDLAGDFAETSDSLANSQRILKARLSDLQAELGTQLLPVVEETTANVLFLVESIDTLSESAGAADTPIKAYKEGIKLLTGPLGAANDMISFLREQLEDTQGYESSREAGRELKPVIEDNTEAMRDAAWASRNLNDETIELRNEFQALIGIIDDRQQWRDLYKELERTSEIIGEFGESSFEAEEQVDDLRLQVLEYKEALDLPEAVVSKILAEIDEGDWETVRNLILGLEKGVTLPVYLEMVGGTGLRESGLGGLRGVTPMQPATSPTVNVVAAGLDAYSIARALERESVSSGSLSINTTTAVSP